MQQPSYPIKSKAGAIIKFMHAYLIISKNTIAIDEKIKNIKETLDVNLYEHPLASINDVRALNKFIKLRVTTKTAILLKNIDKASIDALNAFLKNLEEPQKNLYFILTANSRYGVIPTIISRCQLIQINQYPEISKEDLKKVNDFLSADTGDQFNYISSINKKEDSLKFLENLTFVINQKLTDQKTDHKKLTNIYEKSHFAYNAIRKNGNVSLQLTNLVVNI